MVFEEDFKSIEGERYWGGTCQGPFTEDAGESTGVRWVESWGPSWTLK
jgi:hypothetical protein